MDCLPEPCGWWLSFFLYRPVLTVSWVRSDLPVFLTRGIAAPAPRRCRPDAMYTHSLNSNDNQHKRRQRERGGLARPTDQRFLPSFSFLGLVEKAVSPVHTVCWPLARRQTYATLLSLLAWFVECQECVSGMPSIFIIDPASTGGGSDDL